MSVNREIQVGLCAPKSVPYAATSASRRSSQRGLAGVLDVVLLEQHDPVRPAALARSTGPMPPPSRRMPISGSSSISTSAIIQLVDGVQPGEVDAGGLADQAAPAVAADEVRRPERRRRRTARRRRRRRPGAKPTTSRSRRIGTPSSSTQSARMRLEVALPQREHVVVAGREVADVQAGCRRSPTPGWRGPRRGTAPRRRADRAPRSCGRAGRRLAIRRPPDRSRVRRRRRRSRPTPARPPASARSDRHRRSPPRARSSPLPAFVGSWP